MLCLLQDRFHDWEASKAALVRAYDEKDAMRKQLSTLQMRHRSAIEDHERQLQTLRAQHDELNHKYALVSRVLCVVCCVLCVVCCVLCVVCCGVLCAVEQQFSSKPPLHCLETPTQNPPSCSPLPCAGRV